MLYSLIGEGISFDNNYYNNHLNMVKNGGALEIPHIERFPYLL